ncbi:hypothetical protein B0H67DRAFT_478592 [Lasiosphaeris hirsuta]|uniref:FAD-binding domain-containing protein n=1 Tax=Lasiosphaeris hirsuta TaxID=260670 RepID=A0AA40EAA4_9PEZI|nr:hypothetical protein B0H67DRAFT_478592 [Lasiosphaeris hirsuta]
MATQPTSKTRPTSGLESDAEGHCAAPEPFKVAIVGGGLGGVILAIGLLRRHVPVHIYEAASGFGEIGAGVTMGPNAVTALGLISPDLLEALKAHMTSDSTGGHTFLTFRRGENSNQGHLGGEAGPADPEDDILFSLPSAEAAPGWTQTPARMAVHRAHFLDEIIKHVPADSVSFHKTLTNIRDKGHDGGAVELLFADGTSASYQAVIGCDGIKSAARRYVQGASAAPQFAGEYAYRALVPMEEFQALMGVDKSTNGQMYLGHGRYIITYPVEHGKTVNMVGVVRSSTGDDVWPHDNWLVSSTREDLLGDYAGWDDRLPNLLASYGTSEKWALFHHPSSSPYYRGRVCLLGDSAHATSPHLGAGAGQAMEDAYVMAELLGETDSQGGQHKVRGLFAAYDTARRPRSQQVVRKSYVTGFTYTFQEEGVGADVAKIRQVLGDRLRWLYMEDLATEVEDARRATAT